MERNTLTTDTGYDIDADEARYGAEDTKGLEMTDITRDSIQKITVSVAGMGIDELRSRVNPDARMEYILDEEEVGSLFGPDACEVAQGAMREYFGDMLLLGKIEHDAVGRTWRAYQTWDPTTRPVRYAGNGSDAELHGGRPRPFCWRIAAKLLQVKDPVRYWRTMRAAFDKVKVVGLMFPPDFLGDPPKGAAA